MPTVITTDALVAAKVRGRIDDFPRSVKYEKDLEDERTIEKLELERQMWATWGKELKLVTENEVDRTLAANVGRIHQYRDVSVLNDLSHDAFVAIAEHLTSKVQRPHRSLANVALEVDEALTMELGQSLAVTKHLIASRQWQIDMTQPFEPTRPVELLRVELGSVSHEAAGQSARQT